VTEVSKDNGAIVVLVDATQPSLLAAQVLNLPT
jgi:hypothetical protein